LSSVFLFKQKKSFSLRDLNARFHVVTVFCNWSELFDLKLVVEIVLIIVNLCITSEQLDLKWMVEIWYYMKLHKKFVAKNLDLSEYSFWLLVHLRRVHEAIYVSIIQE
jgi:hypothetical protein